MFSLTDVGNQLEQTLILSQQEVGTAALIVGILWAIHLLNVCVGMRLNYLGLIPREPLSLMGIFFSPLLHGHFSHLFFNSIPLFLLIDFMLIATGPQFWVLTLVMIILSGLLTWLVGRRAIHIGASSLIMAYWGFLLTLAIYQPTVFNLIIVVVMLYYLGGLFLSIFPSDKAISFEGHLCGLIAGMATAWYWVS